MTRSMMKSVRDGFLRFWRKGLRGILIGHQSSNQYLNLTGMEDLTKDVMWDVLSRLDFKTVSSCKCVCKRWRDLVMDPYFIKNLLWSKKKNPSLMIHDTSILQRGRFKWIEIQDMVVEAVKEQPVDVVTVHDVDFSHRLVHNQFHGKDIHVTIGSSVNGLICVWDCYGYTYIVNPIAKQYLTLPEPLSTIVKSLGYGFGSLDDATYKVINICQRFSKQTIIEIDVFTLGTNNWREIQPNIDPKFMNSYMGGGFVFNGCVHWISKAGCLFVFDLHSETFSFFLSPPFEGEEKQQDCRGVLGVLKGCLSQGYYYFGKSFTIWVMKEHGVKDSWYKAFTIKRPGIARTLFRPLCLFDGLKGGTLIADAGGKLVAYYLETHTLKTINLSSSPATSNIKSVTIYRPTFLNLQNFVAPNTPVQTFKMERRQEIWMACCFRVATTVAAKRESPNESSHTPSVKH